jgi:restriction endonuclease S subunit
MINTHIPNAPLRLDCPTGQMHGILISTATRLIYECLCSTCRTIPLREAASINSGGTPTKSISRYWDGDVPWASPKDLKVFNLTTTSANVTDEAISERKARLNPASSTLVVTRGMILTRYVPVVHAPLPVTTNQDIRAIHPHEGMDGLYLSAILLGAERYLYQSVTDSTAGQRRIETPNLEAIRIPLLDIKEQERIGQYVLRLAESPESFRSSLNRYPQSIEAPIRIVAKIDQLAARIDEAKGLRDKTIVEAEVLHHNSSRNIFENLSCETVELESVCEQIIDCLHSNPVYSEEGIPTLRSPDVGWGKLLLTQAKRTSEEEYQRRTRRSELFPDDIVLVREGGGTGKAGIIEEGQRLSLGQRVMQVRVALDKALPKFFLYQWLSPLIQSDQIADQMKGSASPHLNIKTMKKFAFRLPPLDEQRRIIAYLDNLQAKIDALKDQQAKSSAELDALLPSILDRAFKGEL